MISYLLTSYEITPKRKKEYDYGEIPENATIRSEYVRCGNPDCKKCASKENREIPQFHGPYLYAYWKEGKKLRKRYIGKSWDDYKDAKIAKEVFLTPAKFRKYKRIREEASKGNSIAGEYMEKLKSRKVSLDWAYRVINDRILQARLFKMLELAEKRSFIHNSQNELVNFVASEMKRAGLDATNKEDFDSYLNSVIT